MYNLYNVTDTEWKALDEIKRKAYEQGLDAGRALGFAAGYAAAQGQPAEKIQQAYGQGQRDALLRKNGVGY